MKVDSVDRKNEYLKICLEKPVEYPHLKTGFDEYQFIPRALPELDLKEINTGTTFFKKPLRAPIFIPGMTGGTPEGKLINPDFASIGRKSLKKIIRNSKNPYK